MVFLPGMEVAAYLSDKASSVSCIDITTVPFERVLGEPIGKMLQSVCSSRSVTFLSIVPPPPPFRCTKRMVSSSTWVVG